MTTTTRPFLAALLALTLALPTNIYLIGDGIGAGIQFALFRYQQTYMGTNLITLFRDLDYVTSGILAGRSALSVLLWLGGTLLLLVAVACLVLKRHEEYETFRKPLSLLVTGAGIAYLAAVIAQYGPLFHGPAGFSVPVGVPLLLGVAWIISRGTEEENEREEDGMSCIGEDGPGKE
ncbi:hypothetical protein E2N92_04095 [Methanofollis formosanus]|uniref:Uncharacterized protein n=1 Tax=Methanofollis formosanus TaxID=299308 RepID=A0A8G1EG87_9EURY|nr:hypothetical protein [Methanofollis formosanus]QYZ78662.1 hypothetical protein E2N92_04095 [Methanofollis formosanus]